MMIYGIVFAGVSYLVSFFPALLAAIYAWKRWRKVWVSCLSTLTTIVLFMLIVFLVVGAKFMGNGTSWGSFIFFLSFGLRGP
jgi:hypothetical protein